MMPTARTLEGLRAELAAVDPGALRSRGAMSPAVALGHCAQSIEYSISGYPRAKPWPVRRLIGPRLLARFRAARRMRHDLAAPVPGAPSLAEGPPVQAMQRLLAAIDAFLAHRGPWPEHLAFGRMDRAAYADAHWLHIRNHLEEIDFAP